MDFILPGCTNHLYNNNFDANHSLCHLVTQKQHALYYAVGQSDERISKKENILYLMKKRRRKRSKPNKTKE
jgi:hypothetical protein